MTNDQKLKLARTRDAMKDIPGITTYYWDETEVTVWADASNDREIRIGSITIASERAVFIPNESSCTIAQFKAIVEVLEKL